MVQALGVNEEFAEEVEQVKEAVADSPEVRTSPGLS
jgi:hypothetical protein